MIGHLSFWKDCPVKEKDWFSDNSGIQNFVNFFERPLKNASLFLPQTLDITY
jgi:hypothetical protein